MKRLGRFFSLALLTAVTLIISAVQVFAANAPFDFNKILEEWGAGALIVLVIAVLLVIFFIVRAVGHKKSLPKEPEAPSQPIETAKPTAEAPTTKEAPVVAETPVEAPKASEPTATEVKEKKEPVKKKTPTKIEATVGEQIPMIEEVKPEPKCEFAELSDGYAVEAKEIPAEATDPETGCTYTFDENGIPVPPEGRVIRYKWSFLGRLSQAHPEVKYHYMTLRRTLLAYAKMRSNISWNFDSYFVGRRTVAKLKIRGKNLVVYFPIDPKEMEGTKYVGEDASKVSRYKAVPFAYAINGTRKLKYAIELIEKLMEGKSDKAPDLVDEADVNVYIPERDFNTLYNRELIRIGGFLSVGAKASDEDDE